MTQSPFTPSPLATSSARRIAFIQSSWHADIVDQARLGFLGELPNQHLSPDLVDRFDVPGAFEIPLHAKLLAQTGRYAAIVAAALVVDGGVYRHDFVAGAVIDGLMQVQLQTETPVFSVVLTPHHFHDHDLHRRVFHEHFVTKGVEAARACGRTLQSLERLKAAA